MGAALIHRRHGSISDGNILFHRAFSVGNQQAVRRTFFSSSKRHLYKRTLRKRRGVSPSSFGTLPMAVNARFLHAVLST